MERVALYLIVSGQPPSLTVAVSHGQAGARDCCDGYYC